MKIEQGKSPEISFKCEICRSPSSIINILPIRQQDGKLNTLACDKCAEKSGAFCPTHQRPHLGFEDGTTACKVCIDEKVATDTEKITNEFFSKIKNSPHKKRILEELDNWADSVYGLTGLPYDVNVSRAVVTTAFRLKKTPEEIVDQVSKEGPGVILPWAKEKDED